MFFIKGLSGSDVEDVRKFMVQKKIQKNALANESGNVAKTIYWGQP